MCEHSSVRVGSMRAERVDGCVVLTIAAVTCKQCGEELRLAGDKVFSKPGGREFSVALKAASRDPSSLRCDRCGCRLFGRAEEGAELDQSPIVGVSCGLPHVVELANGKRLSVSNGTIKEVQSGKQGSDEEAQ